MNLAFRAEGISQAQKLLLLAYADVANDDGEGIWMSNANLAKRCCCSKRNIIRIIAQVRELGLITASRRTRESGADSTNEVRLNVQAMESLTNDRGDEMSPGDRLSPSPEFPEFDQELPNTAQKDSDAAQAQPLQDNSSQGPAIDNQPTSPTSDEGGDTGVTPY